MTESAEAEKAVGIECYATGGPPCSGRAKSSPEDFLVEERLSAGEISRDPLPDYFPLYRVEKRFVDTLHMSKDLEGELRSKVSFGGLKDKRAVAVQYMTPTSHRARRPGRVAGENYVAELVGYVPRPMTRARVTANEFTVVLRGCCPEVGARAEEALRLAELRHVPNYYGLQRFGTSGAGTHSVGKALVGTTFEEAVKLLLEAPLPGEDEAGRAAIDAMSKGRYDEGVKLLPPGKDVERSVAAWLVRRPGDWVGALRRVPIKLRRLYVQAYQSYLFNRTLSRAMMEGEDISVMKPGDNWAEASPDGLSTSAPRGVRDAPTGKAVPMVQVAGYAYRDYGSRFDRRLKAVLESEGVSPSSFYLKNMQEVSAEGGFRRPHLAVRGASSEEADETATLKFALGKGQYATVLLREVLKPRDPAASGLA